MPAYREHDITLASFAQIQQEMTAHGLTPGEFAVVRRVIHTTADFEFQSLVRFSAQPIEAAKVALAQGLPIITDVSMVAAGIGTVVRRTWQPGVTVAVQQAPKVIGPTQTRTAAGMLACVRSHPSSIIVIGNAPTALMAVCDEVSAGRIQPALIIGAPVGFINVVESKQALAQLSIPHIVVTGRKGGSAVAAAILNALMIWTWEQA